MTVNKIFLRKFDNSSNELKNIYDTIMGKQQANCLLETMTKTENSQ